MSAAAQRSTSGTNGSLPAMFRRVGVVGCGLMGSGIAEVAARAGLEVVVREVSEEAVQAGRERVERSLARAVRGAKLPQDEAAAALARIAFTTELGAMADREIVIEAAAESEPLKREIFAELDRVVRDQGALLASNTSSIPITRLAGATTRPHSVVGMHFFNPVPVMPLVEVVSSVLTAQETADAASAFARDVLGKEVIVAKDRAGFVVNALLVPYLISAVRMLESGLASAEDIDRGMVLGCGHPMGPLTLCDFVGLDTTLAAAESLYEEMRDPFYSPPPLLRRMVEAGILGRKSGRGFYGYGD